ncbi:gliding motility protein GldN [Coprobacter tertius]|uniref:Gliding motility protein GldN n=1 Tax=Coprobacter tertius TaxID=2944915 RepID=A0ABT1MG82_9BACT|nr:gliding motility protein GldN [Coprobacter tertius]MCP9610688.1 gliding motility protein GldN [Coprobacter tertius]
MKLTKFIWAIACFSCSLTVIQAQTANRSTVRTASPDKEEKSVLSVRAQNLYDNTGISEADIPWERVIYRELDLTKEKNLPLYFPEEVIDGQENLFRMIMRLLLDNQIPAYEYLDGREIFSDQYKLKLKEGILDRFEIMYEEKEGRTTKTTRYIVEDSDIPTNLVLSYYLKERWIFDQRNSKFYPEIIAICPILSRTGDFGGEPVKYPMFWIRYNDLRPYLSQQYILADNENNVRHYTYDDYFQLRMFDGDIYKTMNLRNISLQQQYPSDTARIAAQKKIEDQLKNFDSNLWVTPPTANKAEAKAEKDDKSDNKETKTAVKEQTEVKNSVRSKRSSRGSKSSSVKSSKSGGSKSSSKSAPVRSVRRTR